MTAMLPAAALALPQLAAEIPTRYVVPGVDALTLPLTIALLEADVITAPMLRAPRNALLLDVFGEREKQLSERALSHWWTKLIRQHPCKFFRWKLHVQQLEDYNGRIASGSATAWFCFTRIDGHMPRFALARGVERLELLREGFGQTVLAVLQDACDLLPDSLTPWQALRFAEYMYWRDSRNDTELLEIAMMEHDYETVQDLVEHERIVTRAMFFAELPEWVCSPARVLSRAEIEAAASNEEARHVVRICDALCDLVNRPDFTLRPQDKGAYRCGHESHDAAMILIWKEHDVISQAIDDYLQDLYNGGDSCEFIDANPTPMTAAGVREFMALTEQSLQVAVLVEQLLERLGGKF